MSELDDSHDWPLRDFSARLRPPSPPDEQADEEREEPPALTQQFAVEEQEEPEPEPTPELPRTDASEVEVLYDEDDPVPAAAEDDPAPAAAEEPEPAAAAPEEPALGAPGVEPEEDEEEEQQQAPAELAAAPAPPAVEEQQDEEPEPEPQHAVGDLQIPDGCSVLEGAPTGQRRTVAIVVSRFNGEITNRLLESALGALDEAGVSREAVLVMPVPGAFELPIAAMALAKTRRYSCVVALGCVIRGETPHFDFVASEAASGLQLAGIETGVPVSLGLLTCNTAEQAEARVDRGAWAARTALEMADAFAQLRTAVARS
jgi:6,7-dimethyl-8-ribityllumazine synthase